MTHTIEVGTNYNWQGHPVTVTRLGWDRASGSATATVRDNCRREDGRCTLGGFSYTVVRDQLEPLPMRECTVTGCACHKATWK